MVRWISWVFDGRALTSTWALVNPYQFALVFITLASLRYLLGVLFDGEDGVGAEDGAVASPRWWRRFGAFVRSQHSSWGARVAIHGPSLAIAYVFAARFYMVARTQRCEWYCNGVPQTDAAVDPLHAVWIYRFYVYTIINHAYSTVLSVARGAQAHSPSSVAYVAMWWTFVHYNPGGEVIIIGFMSAIAMCCVRVVAICRIRAFKQGIFILYGVVETVHFILNWWNACQLPLLYYVVHYVSSMWLIPLLSAIHWFYHLSLMGWVILACGSMLSIVACCLCWKRVQREAMKRQEERIANSPFIPTETHEDASLSDRVSNDGRQLAETGISIALKMISAASSVHADSQVLDHEYDGEDLCVVCLDAPARVKLLPCGHVCLCEDCSRTYAIYGARDPSSTVYTTCPLCRESVSGSIAMRVVVEREDLEEGDGARWSGDEQASTGEEMV